MPPDQFRAVRKWLYLGLGFAIVANLLIIPFAIEHGTPPAGNVVAVIVCSGAVWLIRLRSKGRL